MFCNLTHLYHSHHFSHVRKAGKFIKELSVTTKVKRVELQKDRDIYEQHAGYFGRHCQINGEFPNRLHAVYLLLRHVSLESSIDRLFM